MIEHNGGVLFTKDEIVRACLEYAQRHGRLLGLTEVVSSWAFQYEKRHVDLILRPTSPPPP